MFEDSVGDMTGKKAIWMAVSFFSLVVLLLMYYLGVENYSDHIIDNNKFEEIVGSRALADDMSVQVSFDKQNLFYDDAAKTFSYR